MNLKGNKGEWSELYAFFKLLADGRLYCGDGRLNRFDDRYYPILEIFRNDEPDRNTYTINVARNKILVAGETTNIEVPRERFREEAQKLLEHIKTLDADTDFSYLESFMSMIDCNTVKAKSTDKADIRIKIHNLNTGSKPEMGYSIKSKIGAESTLINSNKDGTNFIYRVSALTAAQIAEFNALDKFKKKFDYLKSLGATVTFCNVANKTLRNNLLMLDLGMERIVGESMLHYYRGEGRTVEEISQLVSAEDPLGIMHDTDQPMYSYKIKQFLLAFALGMTGAKPWYGTFNANGGYIVVREDGEIVCFHFFDRNDLEDYLFFNTRFETPSTTRHNFGDIYEENGECYLKLNLQVRFK